MYKGGFNLMKVKDGDIIKTCMIDGREVFKVVIKVFERYAATLNLYSDENKENDYMVDIGKCFMHADLGKISFVRYNDLNESEYVFHIFEDDMTALLSKIGETLGIPQISVPNNKEKTGDVATEDAKCLQDEVELLTEEQKRMRNDLDSARKACAEAEKKAYMYERDIIKTEAERDVYKSMYMDILGKMGFEAKGA